MTFRRTIVTTTAALLLAGAPSSAMAGLPSAPTPAQALDVVDQRLAPVRAKVNELRRTLAAETVLGMVRATALAAGKEAALRSVRLGEQMPTTLGGAIALLQSAMTRADRIVRNGPASRLAHRFTVARAIQLSFIAMHSPGALKGMPTPDASAALRASAVLASAIDRSLPALRRAAGDRQAGASSAAAPGCDLVDQTPNLCVGGPGDNVYSADEALEIDLAGNDTYLNNAGAPQAAGVSVSLDLAGNDIYDAPPSDVMAQGGASLGVGMLVDGAGDDTYRMVSGTGATGGQGLGFFGGAGFLFDGTGNDTYVQDSEVTGKSAGAAGQGEGFFGGVAAVVDSGVGDDTHVMRVVMTPQEVTTQDEDGNDVTTTQMGAAASAAQGVGGFGGAGLFSDSGGKDSFSIDVRIVGAPADGAPVERTYDPSVRTIQQYVQSAGQGDAILGGGAYFLEGPGDTTYSQSAVMEPLPIHDPGIYGSVVGQGDGPTGTTGVLSDPSGNDTYSARVSIASSVAFTATDGCACDQDVNAEIGAVNSIVQGYGGNGEGLLDDGGGNDSFTIDLSSSADLSIDDHRTAAVTPLQGSAAAGKITAFGQGLGAGAAGTGALVNAAGDDSYVFRASSTADAVGSATTAENAPATSSYPADVVLDGQGTGTLNGLGALIDLGGSDTYRASASSSGSTGAGDPASGVLKLHAQGAVDASPSFGVLVDLDGTGTDTFASTPAVAACQGVRGQGTWQDCGQYGGGVNA